MFIQSVESNQQPPPRTEVNEVSKTDIQLTRVKSSNVSAIASHEDDLIVLFKGGGPRGYVYPELGDAVSDILEAQRNGESVGKVVNEIIDGFGYERIEDLTINLKPQSQGVEVALSEWTMDEFHKRLEMAAEAIENDAPGIVDLNDAHLILPRDIPEALVEMIGDWIEEVGGDRHLDMHVGRKAKIMTLTNLESATIGVDALIFAQDDEVTEAPSQPKVITIGPKGVVKDGDEEEVEKKPKQKRLPKVSVVEEDEVAATPPPRSSSVTVVKEADTEEETDPEELVRMANEGLITREELLDALGYSGKGKNPQRRVRVTGDKDAADWCKAVIHVVNSLNIRLEGEPLTVFLPYDAPKEVRRYLEDEEGIFISDDMPPSGHVGVGIEMGRED